MSKSSDNVKIQKEHFSSTAKAKNHAASLLKSGIKARVAQTIRNKKT